MKLTKYQHACFTVEKDGAVLVIDPGNLTADFVSPENVIAVVITHEHADHFDPDILAAIYDGNPNSLLIAGLEITEKMPDHKSRIANTGNIIEVGPFTLEFSGGQHATIHESMPTVANLGIMIDNTVYYPGDSFTKPEKAVAVLALPVAAPWLKISEVMDFLTTVKPTMTFPTHDAILSSSGKAMVDRMLMDIAKQYDGVYQRINQPLDI